MNIVYRAWFKYKYYRIQRSMVDGFFILIFMDKNIWKPLATIQMHLGQGWTCKIYFKTSAQDYVHSGVANFFLCCRKYPDYLFEHKNSSEWGFIKLTRTFLFEIVAGIANPMPLVPPIITAVLPFRDIVGYYYHTEKIVIIIIGFKIQNYCGMWILLSTIR